MKSAATTDRDLRLVGWRNAVFGIFGISGFAFATWASRVPDVRNILHASTAEMGLLILGIAAGAIAGLLASSHVVAVLGATRTIRWAYTVAPVGLIVAGVTASVAPTFVALLIGLILFGTGTGSLEVAMNLSGAASERAIGRTLMPLFHAAFSLGTVLGAAVGALTLLLHMPIGVHLGVVGAFAVVVTHVLVRHLQPAEVTNATGEIETAHGWRSRLNVWRDLHVLMIGVLILGFALAEGSANDWLSLAMVDGHGVSQAAGAAIFGVFVAAMTIGRAGGMLVLDRFGRVPVLRASAVLAVTGLLIVIFVRSTAMSASGVVLWGFGTALGFPVGMSAAADDPRTATASVSAVATIGYFAFLVGPPGIGFLGQHFGLLNALLAVLVLIAAAGAASSAARPLVRSSAFPTWRT